VVREPSIEDAGKRVAAVTRDEIDPDAAGRRLRGPRRRVERHFLRPGVVLPAAKPVRCARGRHHLDAVLEQLLIARDAAVDRQDGHRCRPSGVHAADVRLPRRHPGDGRPRHVVDAARQRDRIDHLSIDDALLHGVPDIDDRRLARHRDGFLNGAH
jgi:hypothetical protein